MKLTGLTLILAALGGLSLAGCANQNPCLTPQIDATEMKTGVLISDDGLKDLLRYIECLENK
ncbi:MAG: hypothetical protein ACRDD9_23670 [Shewanella sp.]